MNCSLTTCTNPAPTFTLCEEHQEQLGIRVRREDHRRWCRGSDHPKKPGTLPPMPDRPPLPPGRHTVGLPEWAIHTVRDAYMHPSASLRSVAEEIGVSVTVVQRIIRSVPGDPVERRTVRLLEEWAQLGEGVVA